MKNKIWFVTGASKGLGLALVQKLLSEGYHVAATSRSFKELEIAIGSESANFLPLQVDLVDDSSVKIAIEQTIQYFGGLDVVVNNAGYGQMGAIEEVSDSFARMNFDINVFGTLNVIRNALPFLRNQESGYIFNISSIVGFSALNGNGIYAATKFAVDGLSESLAQEVKPFGIKVTSVKPGYFRTNFLSTNTSLYEATNPIEAYEEYREIQVERRKSFNGNQIGDPRKAAQVLINLSMEENPPIHLFLGKDAYKSGKEKIRSVEKDMDVWKALATSTDFDE